MSEQAVLATSNPELERQNTPTVGDIRQQYKKNKDHDRPSVLSQIKEKQQRSNNYDRSSDKQKAVLPKTVEMARYKDESAISHDY
jgi:hypothetical protein